MQDLPLSKLLQLGLPNAIVSCRPVAVNSTAVGFRVSQITGLEKESNGERQWPELSVLSATTEEIMSPWLN